MNNWDNVYPLSKDGGVRWVMPEDAVAILMLTNELIIASGAAFESRLTAKDLLNDLFGADRKSEVIVFEMEGNVVGYLSFSRGYGPWQSISTMMINAVSVSAAYTRKGIGKQLFRFAADIACQRGWRRIELYTDIHYAAAKHFYQKLGFEFSEVAYGKCSARKLSGHA